MEIGDLLVPNRFSGAGIETEQVRIRRAEIEPVPQHSHTPLTDHVPTALPLEVPHLAAGPGVDCPDMVGNSEIQDPVDQKRSGFDGLLMRLKRPRHSNAAGIVPVDLGQSAVAPSSVIAVIARPYV